ncbi:MAG TPA: outer membrane beta-barrel protein [Gemmatimonadota bacterium]|nr:outer membrane beta-barrel protein [Gemmatimonadota bacterium]
MGRARSWLAIGAVALVVSAMSAAPGHAQRPLEVTVGAHVGGSIFTEFLEQRANGGERELVAKTSPTIGGSISLSKWDFSEVRLSADWSGTEIEFQDDSGDDSDDLDEEGLADVNLVLAQLAIVRHIMPRDATISPYLLLGVNLGMWALDEDAGGEIGAEEETQVRFGATTGIGMRFAASPRMGFKVEIDRSTVGNPFDGKSAFRIGGDTFDEPSTLGVLRLLAGLAYTF